MSKILIKKTLLQVPDVGVCTIDLDMAVKLWDSKCQINRWEDNFKLIRTPRRNANLKVTLHSEDTRYLIKALKLVKVDFPIFKSASTYVNPEGI